MPNAIIARNVPPGGSIGMNIEIVRGMLCVCFQNRKDIRAERMKCERRRIEVIGGRAGCYGFRKGEGKGIVQWEGNGRPLVLASGHEINHFEQNWADEEACRLGSKLEI